MTLGHKTRLTIINLSTDCHGHTIWIVGVAAGSCLRWAGATRIERSDGRSVTAANILSGEEIGAVVRFWEGKHVDAEHEAKRKDLRQGRCESHCDRL